MAINKQKRNKQNNYKMSTILYQSPIFGPVHSRRLGISLGINLQPADGKICTFDCIYCECGLNKEHTPHSARPTRECVAEALERTLKDMREKNLHLDVLTFAGNGEPTGHPGFAEIIDDTIKIRDKYFPEAKISVLSNSTFIHRKEVHEALMRVDNNILKLDTVDMEYISTVDRPTSPSYDVENIVGLLKSFEGHVSIQTIFMKGTVGGKDVDNTSDRYVLPWLEKVKMIGPKNVMVYTIDRETPIKTLEKASKEELDRIRDMVIAQGIPCTASY